MQLPLVNRLPDAGPHYGVVAEFASPGDLMRACEGVRDAGFTRWDAHCPFPVHGLGNAMGLKRSVLPLLVLVCGLGGAVAGMGLQWWTSAVDYPLVISDVRMPGMTGLEVQERMNQAGMDVPVIFITAHEEEGIEEQALRAGAVGFLRKPFMDEALVGLIRKALECPRKPVASEARHG